MKASARLSFRRFAKHSLILAAIIVPVVSAISLNAEVSTIKAEQNARILLLRQKKLGTLRRLSSASDSIKFLGISLSTIGSKALREKLVRNFLTTQHYFHKITLVEVENATTIFKQKEGEIMKSDTKPFTRFKRKSLERSSKSKSPQHINLTLLQSDGNESDSLPELSISTSIPGKPLWLITGSINIHDLLYFSDHISSSIKPNIRENGFACLRTAKKKVIMVHSDKDKRSSGNSRCNDIINNTTKSANDAYESAILGKELLATISLSTDEASRIVNLGHSKSPSDQESISIRLVNNVEPEALNRFLLEKLIWIESGLLFVGIVAFATGHYALDKAHQKEQYKKSLISLASTDPLTGVYNRRAIVDLLDKKIKDDRSEGHFLLFLDIDHFKDINDTLGHDTGDKMICHVCKQAALCIRKNDATGRIGGDEILVLLDSVGTKNNALKIAENILRQCRETLHSSELHVSVTVSIGIAPCGVCRSAIEWINYADRALYKAKASGRNCIKSADDQEEDIGEMVFIA